MVCSLPKLKSLWECKTQGLGQIPRGAGDEGPVIRMATATCGSARGTPRSQRNPGFERCLTAQEGALLASRKETQTCTRQTLTRNQKPNENENRPTPWGEAKAVLRGKLIAANSYGIKKKRSQIDHLIFHLKKMDQGQQTQLQTRVGRN